MTLLKTEVLVLCPKMNCKVNVEKQCASGQDPTADRFQPERERCRHFKHLTYVGYGILVCCSFPKYADVES